MGSLEYRGYFSKPGATNYGAYLRRKGYDVSVGGVTAYSTLGWFKDPVLNTFIYDPDAELAETIFHELGHQRVFARGDTDFNEAFATSVGEEGARRWLKAKRGKEEFETYLAHLRHTREFVGMVMKARAQLENLYGDEHLPDGKIKSTDRKRDVPREELRRDKQRIMAQLKDQLRAARSGWGKDDAHDAWLEHQINNAHLNSVAAYYDLVPGFEQLLALKGGDLEKYFAAADQLSKKPRKERQEWLRTLAQSAPAPGAPAPAQFGIAR